MDGTVNWTALDAFGNLLAALVTVIAVVAALASARAAIQIDQNQGKRVKERELRDAIPIATAIHSEISKVRAVSLAIVDHSNQASFDHWEFLQFAKWSSRSTETPILDRAALSLGCFDAVTARSLAITGAAISSLRSRLDNPLFPAIGSEPEDWVPKEISGGYIETILQSARSVLTNVEISLTALKRYVDVGENQEMSYREDIQVY